MRIKCNIQANLKYTFNKITPSFRTLSGPFSNTDLSPQRHTYSQSRFVSHCFLSPGFGSDSTSVIILVLSGNVDFPYGALADPGVGGSGGLTPPFTLRHDFFCSKGYYVYL